eukprot:scaffold24309_cov47-Prasinocladus_malaysianus.AAC.1
MYAVACDLDYNQLICVFADMQAAAAKHNHFSRTSVNEMNNMASCYVVSHANMKMLRPRA